MKKVKSEDVMSTMQFLSPKIITILIAVTLLSTCTVFPVTFVEAATETIVEVEPQTISAKVGDQFTVNITVVDIQDMYSIDAALYWNGTILEVVSVDVRLGKADGVLYEPIFIVENSTKKGKYSLVASSYGAAPVFYGNGTVAKITFRAIASGNSTLNLETLMCTYPPPDIQPSQPSERIEHVAIDGFVSIASESSDVSFPWIMFLPLLVVVGLVAFVLLWKRVKWSRRVDSSRKTIMEAIMLTRISWLKECKRKPSLLFPC